MTTIKKIIFFIIKSTFAILALLILILFFYSAFFYEPPDIEKEIVENEIKKEEEKLRLEEEKIQKKLSEEAQKKSKIKQVKTKIKDGLYATVGNKAITRSDIVNEIKKILILNEMSYSDDIKDKLQQMAVKSRIKKSIKEIEISNYDDAGIGFSQNDLNNELNKLASNIDMDVDTLKKIFISNGLDFLLIENQLKTELIWNSLIFYLYKDRVSINLEEIDEQLKLSRNKEEFEEYLVSELIIKPVEKSKLKSKIEEIKRRIITEGFENVAMNLSISQTAIKGGNLGWLNENVISKKFRSIISNTPVSGLSEAILLQDGILFFHIRDKRKITKKIDLQELKDQLVNSEKSKILNMYSRSHYDNLRRTISIKFFNE